MMKKKLSIIPYITFISIILIFFYLLIIQRNPSEIPSVFINKEIPKFESSSILNKKKFVSSENFNNEVTLVNFFATWCKPCRDEHIFIKKFAETNNIKVLGINYGLDSAAALGIGEEIIAACEQERYDLKKHSTNFLELFSVNVELKRYMYFAKDKDK